MLVGSPSLWASSFSRPPFQPTTSPSSALQNLAPVCKSLTIWRSALAPLNTLFLEATESVTAFHGVGQGAGHSADASPTPHVRMARSDPASDRKSDLESGGELSWHIRQLEGTDLCLDVVDYGKLFSFLIFFPLVC